MLDNDTSETVAPHVDVRIRNSMVQPTASDPAPLPLETTAPLDDDDKLQHINIKHLSDMFDQQVATAAHEQDLARARQNMAHARTYVTLCYTRLMMIMRREGT